MLDVLVNLEMVSGSGLHPHVDVLAEVIILYKWGGFKNVASQDIVLFDFLG